MIAQLRRQPQWDILVIGGGATGLGIALDAASRGFRTALVEQHDFAKGTSSRSTKLVHGGVRYLAQGSVRLVYTALRERGILLKNAAHVVRPQAFVIPCYHYGELLKYALGLQVYDLLSGRYSFGRSTLLRAPTVAERFGNLNTSRLKGGVQYYDGQFDDARLAVNIAQTAAEHTAVLANYCQVTAMHHRNGRVNGVEVLDRESGDSFPVYSTVVINATGVFVDDLLRMDDVSGRPLVRPSQGVHLVLDRAFLPSPDALMIPRTSDGRVLFVVPWNGFLLTGTTDTPLDKSALEPRALDDEVQFILDTISRYLRRAPGRDDVRSVFAGLRPLAAPSGKQTATRDISRDHKLVVSSSGLITITGGKWTTYRQMAQVTVDQAIRTGALPNRKCRTADIPIHGHRKSGDHPHTHLSVYGSDEEAIHRLIGQEPSLGEKLVEEHPYTGAEVIWAVRHEMARTVEDVLARRLRLLFLDAQAAGRAAPRVAELLARERGLDGQWQERQVRDFRELARQYLPDGLSGRGRREL